MPRGDGTGPGGMGPMTGRAAGYCAGYSTPGFANAGFGRGLGLGFRGGRGRRWVAPQMNVGFRAPYAVPYGVQNVAPTQQQELEALQNQAEYFTNALEDIKARIKDLETKKEK